MSTTSTYPVAFDLAFSAGRPLHSRPLRDLEDWTQAFYLGERVEEEVFDAETLMIQEQDLMAPAITCRKSPPKPFRYKLA